MEVACGGAWVHPGGPGLLLLAVVVELPAGVVVVRAPALLQCEPE